MHEITVIRIISCVDPDTWYFDHIGCTVEVVEKDNDYILLEDYMIGYSIPWHHIEKQDCEFLSVKKSTLDS